MKLTDIISISGKPGLYNLINRTRSPFTAEDLESGRKLPLFPRDNIVSLGDISIYTTEGDMPLGEVLQKIQEKYPNGIQSESDLAKDTDKLHAFMSEVLPIYDSDRVHNSDIKKLIKWYNILKGAGMDTFVPDKEEEKEDIKG